MRHRVFLEVERLRPILRPLEDAALVVLARSELLRSAEVLDWGSPRQSGCLLLLQVVVHLFT